MLESSQRFDVGALYVVNLIAASEIMYMALYHPSQL